jgi:hypothetical protein
MVATTVGGPDLLILMRQIGEALHLVLPNCRKPVVLPIHHARIVFTSAPRLSYVRVELSNFRVGRNDVFCKVVS